MKRVYATALAVLVCSGALAAAPDWNGTWVGNWQNGDGVQIVMAGNLATAIYWHGDYLPDDLHAKVSADGKTLTISWRKSSAVLIRDGQQTARLVIHEPGQADIAFGVRLDH